ncbi:MAG: hypothetical protein JRF17_07155 [Deltaproteobacteria bacterium]|jgi:hypothetical protein|nr:hypothetical protein [Deltaproteobacteria bacterium]MBW2491153.1 hypothetical protein [Deltaproteobacteria bacterium]
MNAHEYYHRVIDRLKNCFQLSHYVVATGNELVAEGSDPAFPAASEPIDRLEPLTLQRALQVHIPLIGKRSQSVLMPIDFEIFLGEENHLLYEEKVTQRKLFDQVMPVIHFLENLFRSRGMPYILDYTPSGAHILFQNLLGYLATEELRKIGFLEEDLIKACTYIDHGDIRRKYGISLDAARVFSGLGKIAEYIALLTMEAFKENASEGLFPITISDSDDRCLNFDNSWSEGSPFMRSIRSPFSLHKKNQEKYGKYHDPPLVDVIGTYFDGNTANEETNVDVIIDCMWDLEKAACHAQRFSGFIPCSNETLIDFIREYKSSDLYLFHQDFDSEKDIPRGFALEAAKKEENIPDWTRQILFFPNPSALQPKKMIGLVFDFLIYAHWKPKHIANILRDIYQNPSFNWTQDFFKYPAEEKANFWARTYSVLALWKTGKLHIESYRT